jgi:hypothetical protein
MTELEKQQAKEIQELKKLLGLIEEDKPKAFSSIDTKYLKKVLKVKKKLSDNIFEKWFSNNIVIDEDIELFLKNLLQKYGKILKQYNEDTLKVVFIGAILSKVDFINQELDIGNFYNAPLSFKNDKINFNGFCDFYVASGLDYPDNPYFFIQEYKPSQGGGDPEPQLVAEMICAIELNNWKEIKGCFIVGAIWNFVILEKLDKDK